MIRSPAPVLAVLSTAPANFWQTNEITLVAAGAIALIALGLLAAAWLSSRARVRPAPPPATPPSPREIAPPPSAPTPAPTARKEPEPVLSPEERRQRKVEEEERKRAAYRARKEEEGREREALRLAKEAERARAEEDAARAVEAESRRQAEALAERQRSVQAQAGKTLAEGLAKTRGGFVGRLNALFGGEKLVDDALLGQLEELLFSADIGVATASHLLEVARDGLARKSLSDPEKIKGAMRAEIERMVSVAAPPRAEAGPGGGPTVWMVVGVNGVGKTTTIGKLAAQLTGEGKKVLLGAGDTFRAAAAEQLEIWGGRAGAQVVKGSEGSDPGSVAFEAVKRARELGVDLVLTDTAGRLHTKAPLMEELKKMKRVLEKAQPGAPHEVLLVLDATNGQNAIAQARQFHEALGVTGIALTKLDGTAKGGVVIGICAELGIPIRYVGVGEAVGDLKSFEPHGFVEALFS